MSIAGNGAAIRAEHVSRHYQMGSALIRAVDDVTLEVGAGEFLALLGTSGSGKSTLLNLMAGLDRPTAGAIVTHGRNLSELNSIELAQYRSRTVGMVFQSFNLLPKMTLEENVELPLRLAEVDRNERGERVRVGTVDDEAWVACDSHGRQGRRNCGRSTSWIVRRSGPA